MEKSKPKDLFSKCGNTCSSCPSFKSNLQTTEDRKRCSAGWERYLNIKLSPEKLRACDGCQFPDCKKPTRYLNCRVRRCAVFNDVLTCAHCSAYPCGDIQSFTLPSDTRQKVADRLGEPVPEEAYLAFIEPYEGLKHLDQIRASLTPEDIKEMTKISFKPRVTAFPDLTGKRVASYRHLHGLIENMCVTEGISYARRDAFKKDRDYGLRLLWTFGCFGELQRDQLVIDGKTYLGQKKMQAMYSKVLNHYFKVLEKHGVRCEHVPLAKEGWLTPTGGLRPKGWLMKMSFDAKLGGVPTLKALQSYSTKLHEKHGKKAYRYFSKADMRVLGGCSKLNCVQ